MINLIQSPCTSHAYRELLTHVMGNKHKVGGDGVGDDGGEDHGGGGTPLREKVPPSWQGRFSRYIRTCAEGEAELMLEARTDLGGTVSLWDHAT